MSKKDVEDLRHDLDMVMDSRIKLLDALDHAERILAVIAGEISVPVKTKTGGGISHRKMYKAWRHEACWRADVAREFLERLEDNP